MRSGAWLLLLSLFASILGTPASAGSTGRVGVGEVGIEKGIEPAGPAHLTDVCRSDPGRDDPPADGAGAWNAPASLMRHVTSAETQTPASTAIPGQSVACGYDARGPPLF
jgi:hypothetical protein